MKTRKYAALIAAVMAMTSMTSVMSGYVSAEGAGYAMNVSVKLDGERKAISPYIYGVNEYGNVDNLKNITVGAIRQGGNRYTGYNWETNWSNAGEDWHNMSDTNIGDVTNGPAYAAQKLSKTCDKYDIPYKMTTLQMAGYVSADKNGEVTEAAPSSRWNEVQFNKDSELSMTPDLEDGTVYMDEYVNYIVNTLGDSTTAAGIQGYSLDNEPVLWDNTHPYLHGASVTNNELVSKSIELAKVVKSIDSNAEVFGPAFWGMLPCVNAGEDGSNGFTDSEWQAVKNNYSWYVDFYLDQMAKAEAECGYRLLDVFDVHYYAQDCSSDASRLQAARSLYDESYAENSWLQPYLGQYFPFLTRLQESIDKYYPGTKLAITEYNLGDIANEATTGKNITAAIAETEALGAFAMNDVYLATYWGTLPNCPYVESAINLYTNYDGEGAAFGDTLVEANTDDLSKAAAFAAVDAGDDTEVTLVLSNKDTSNTQNATISLSGSAANYQSAVVYAITPDSTDIKIIEVDNDVTNNTVSVSLPPLSVAQIVISDEKSDKTVYEEPDIEEKQVTYQINQLEISENGYPMIPLGDKEHLVKAVVVANASCNSGASWFGGGGALTFNNLIDASGTGFWGSKAFSYTNSVRECEIIFDGSFTDANLESVEATIGDEYAELQNWWASSDKDDQGNDVSVTYESVTLYYEYNGEESGTTTTTTTTTTETTTTTTETSESVTETTTTTTVSTETSATVSDSITTTQTTATTASSTSWQVPDATKYGDINLDGTVSMIDLVYLNKNLAKVITLNDAQLANADCFKDTMISSKDTAALLSFLIEAIDSLPVQEG